MEYINCFQITSLVLVTMIAIHYFSHKRLNNAENRNFVCFLAFSGVYVLLDMLSAVIAGGGSSEGCRMSALVLTLYYFCEDVYKRQGPCCIPEGSGSCRVQKNRYCRNDSQGTAESHQPADT